MLFSDEESFLKPNVSILKEKNPLGIKKIKILIIVNSIWEMFQISIAYKSQHTQMLVPGTRHCILL